LFSIVSTNLPMLFHRRRPRNEGIITRFKLGVLIGTEKVEMVKKHRILRLTFHERLNWKEQDTRRKGEGDKEAQSTKKLVSHIMGLGPEKTLADLPNDSLINPQIWKGGLRTSFMCDSETTGFSALQKCKTGYLRNL
jgi:hypothetical protein